MVNLRMLVKFLNRLLKPIGISVSKVGYNPSTFRQHIELLAYSGSNREWQQLAMYSQVMSLTRDVPGDIVEFGVASGTSFSSLVRLNDILNANRDGVLSKKRVLGFDSFEGLPELDQQFDLATSEAKSAEDMQAGGFNSSQRLSDLESFVAKYKNCSLHKGWFKDSLTAYIADNPHASFSLIHIDCDLYESTRDALEPTLMRLNPGGVILFDEVFHPAFPGETQAFFEVVQKFSDTFNYEFQRVEFMPWKWFLRRTR